MNHRNLLLNMYSTMLDELGPSNWWPGESPFEIAVGAVLTQNTNWKNVEHALDNLRQAVPLTPAALLEMPDETMASLIRPAGYFRLKTKRLKNFLAFLERQADSPHDLEETSLNFLDSIETHELRETLLEVNGVGQETADAMLLYALKRPVFVVDAYTARIMNRHMLVPEDVTYEELRDLFTDALPEDAHMFDEYHGLLVRIGKNYCKKSIALCDKCPLAPYLEQ